MAKDVLGAGIIGCGTFCTEYLKTLGPVYKNVKVVACSDIDMDRANRIAKEWGVPHPCTTEELLADPRGLVDKYIEKKTTSRSKKAKK